MITQNVTNNTNKRLNIGGVNIAPGASEEVPNWQNVRDKGAVPTWTKKELITLGDATGEAEYANFVAVETQKAADAASVRAEEAEAKAENNLKLAKRAAAEAQERAKEKAKAEAATKKERAAPNKTAAETKATEEKAAAGTAAIETDENDEDEAAEIAAAKEAANQVLEDKATAEGNVDDVETPANEDDADTKPAARRRRRSSTKED